LEGGCYAVVEMRTEKQKAASRANGRKSRGPVSAMGKDRIRSNALKHGLTAKLTVWPNESPRQFQALLVAMLDRFAPKDDLEFLCVEEMAMAKWRQRRSVCMETEAGRKYLREMTQQSGPHAGAGPLEAFAAGVERRQLLTLLRQQEAAYHRTYQRAYRHLLSLRNDLPAFDMPAWEGQGFDEPGPETLDSEEGTR
jgi:hypothetical protein